MDIKFCVSLPKLELHAHLNGSLSEKTLKELHTSPDSIQMLSLGPTRTLEECFEIFKIAHNATNNTNAIYKATQNVIKEFADDGVVYLELRTTPRKEENMTKRQYIEAIIKGIEQNNSSQIKVKLILSLDRKQSISEAEENVNLAIEYRKKNPNIVVGIDVSGDPSKGKWFQQLLSKVRNESDLKITIHCAEIPNESEVKEILEFKPNRLGHGTCISQQTGGSEELWKLLQDQKIPVECCLTSNVKTKTIENYERHHLKQFLLTDFPFTICTDDKGVFATSLSHEFRIAADVFGLTKNQLWNICFKTIEYTFCTEEEKRELRTLLKKYFQDHLLQETCL